MSRRLLLGLLTVGVLAAFTAPSAMAWFASEGAFSISNLTAEATNADGSLDTQAGGHPYEANTTFDLSGADARYIEVDLPPGFIGNPQATPQCPLVRLTDSFDSCPPDTQVGEQENNIEGVHHPQPVWNIVPEPGKPAEFAFTILGHQVPVILYGSVRTGGDYGLTVTTPGIAQGGELDHVSFTFWGVPADPSHDARRQTCIVNGPPDDCSVGAPGGDRLVPFLTNPVDCAAPPSIVTLRSESWQYPGQVVTRTATVPRVTGCGKLIFEPSIAVTPDTTQIDTPTGLSIKIKVPQTNEPEKLATPELRNTTLTFPEGLAISPSAADGLVGCTDAEFDIHANALGGCPAASQIATVQIVTPLLASPLPGQLYLGAPLCSPCSSADAAAGRVFRVFLQAQVEGALIKLEGTVSADPVSGQLTARFENTPQLPFSELTIHVKGGSRAAFVNPATCATQTTTSDLVAWSGGVGGDTPDANPFSQFSTTWDGFGGACPAGGEPFHPSFTAGTVAPLANAFSPFTLTFERPDGDQPLSGFKLELPPGLLGDLSSVPLCPEPQAGQGTCSEASRIGTTTVGAGSGSHPFFLTGGIYLTGPYKGAPFGISVAVPVVAGPYNLGTVVVRSTITIDQHDAHVTATVDPLPQIVSGVPTRLRIVNVSLDRPGFMFNPTNCTPRTVRATVDGSSGEGVQVASPFNIAGCKGLPFSPKFTARTVGKASRGGGVGLDVKILEGVKGEANVQSIKVDLPKQLPSRLTTLQKACTAAVFEANPANCPAASIVGIAKATTPTLPVPVIGPVYFVSHGGEAFPSLILVLQGDGVRVDLVGATFISKAGITSSTFKTVPDVPVPSFELYLPAGKFSALAANGNLCTSKLAMPIDIHAQNGAELKQTIKIAPGGCATAKKAKTSKSKKKKPTKAQRAATNRRAN
jgi:hypothetical protein